MSGAVSCKQDKASGLTIAGRNMHARAIRSRNSRDLPAVPYTACLDLVQLSGRVTQRLQGMAKYSFFRAHELLVGRFSLRTSNLSIHTEKMHTKERSPNAQACRNTQKQITYKTLPVHIYSSSIASCHSDITLYFLSSGTYIIFAACQASENEALKHVYIKKRCLVRALAGMNTVREQMRLRCLLICAANNIGMFLRHRKETTRVKSLYESCTR